MKKSILFLMGLLFSNYSFAAFTPQGSTSIDKGEINIEGGQLPTISLTFKNTGSSVDTLSLGAINPNYKVSVNRCNNVSPNKTCQVSLAPQRALTIGPISFNLNGFSISMDVVRKDPQGNIVPEISQEENFAFIPSSLQEVLFLSADRTKIFSLSIKNEGKNSAIPSISWVSNLNNARFLVNRCTSSLAPGKTCSISISFNKPLVNSLQNLQMTYSGSSSPKSLSFSLKLDTASNANCDFNGSTVVHGQSINAYSSSSVPFGQTCASQQRTCNNGVLSGNFTNDSCIVQSALSCVANSITYQHGDIVPGYSQSIAMSGENCSSFATSGTCNNGTIDNSPTSFTCDEFSGLSCSFGSQTILPNQSASGFSEPSVPFGSICSPITVSCDENSGLLSPIIAFESCSEELPQSCSVNGQTLAHNESQSFYQSQNVPFGETCMSESRTCNNGQLSGSYLESSCVESLPSNCDFNGTTVAHNQSVYAYQVGQSAGLCSTLENIETRTCYNGNLSGSYTYSSCLDTPQGSSILTLVSDLSPGLHQEQSGAASCVALNQEEWNCWQGNFQANYDSGSYVCKTWVEPNSDFDCAQMTESAFGITATYLYTPKTFSNVPNFTQKSSINIGGRILLNVVPHDGFSLNQTPESSLGLYYINDSGNLIKIKNYNSSNFNFDISAGRGGFKVGNYYYFSTNEKQGSCVTAFNCNAIIKTDLTDSGTTVLLKSPEQYISRFFTDNTHLFVFTRTSNSSAAYIKKYDLSGNLVSTSSSSFGESSSNPNIILQSMDQIIEVQGEIYMMATVTPVIGRELYKLDKNSLTISLENNLTPSGSSLGMFSTIDDSNASRMSDDSAYIWIRYTPSWTTFEQQGVFHLTSTGLSLVHASLVTASKFIEFNNMYWIFAELAGAIIAHDPVQGTFPVDRYIQDFLSQDFSDYLSANQLDPMCVDIYPPSGNVQVNFSNIETLNGNVYFLYHIFSPDYSGNCGGKQVRATYLMKINSLNQISMVQRIFDQKTENSGGSNTYSQGIKVMNNKLYMFMGVDLFSSMPFGAPPERTYSSFEMNSLEQITNLNLTTSDISSIIKSISTFLKASSGVMSNQLIILDLDNQHPDFGTVGYEIYKYNPQ